MISLFSSSEMVTLKDFRVQMIFSSIEGVLFDEQTLPFRFIGEIL